MSSSYPILNSRPIDQWKVTELKEELRKRRLTISGLKQDLINRLNESIMQELANGSKPDPDLQDTHSEGHTDPQDGVQTEDPVEVIENRGTNAEKDATGVDNDKRASADDADHSVGARVEELVTTTDMNVTDEEEPGNKCVNNENDSTGIDNDKKESADNAEHRVGAHVEEPVVTTDLNVTAGEEVRPAVPMEVSVENDCSLQTQSQEIGQFPGHVENKDGKSDNVADEKFNKKSIEVDKDAKLPTEDVNLNKTEPNNQVSEVKSDLGFPVHCESISTDSISFNEKNELKDNLNADNFPIELEVKPEIVHQSSSDVAPIGDDLHHGSNIEEQGFNQGPEGMDVAPNASYESLVTKNDNEDGGYPEKLNLDRSSGDESMEDDVLDNKQIELNVNLETVKDKVDVEEVSVRRPSLLVDNLSSPNKDAVAEEENKSIVAEKRKLEDRESRGASEPVKRRRWNTDTLKVSEQKPSNPTSLGTPMGLSQTISKPTFTRSDSTLSTDSQKARVVPPSQKPPTTSLRIDHFLRPFTLKAVQDMLSKTGTVCSFWMDNIKTHCFVTYSSEEEAVETRNAVYNLQWPPNGGRLLIAEFVDPQEVKMHVEAPPESPVPISPAAVTPTSTQQNQNAQYSSRQHGPKQQLPLPPPPPPPRLSDPLQAKDRLPPTPSSKKPDPPILTLDDLFMKTKFTPRIYYLPLSEEQVAAKKAAQVGSSRG